MCKRFTEWEGDIKTYCVANSLDFNKAQTMVKCSNNDNLILQYFDADSDGAKSGLGLLDETPMPVVLWITRTPVGLRFEQTEHTKQYLS